MINKIKKISYQNKLLLIIFFLSLIVFLTTPIAGDDWGNYVVGSSGIRSILKTTVNMYNTWEGRFISRILIFILTYHKILWSFLNASFITLFIKITFKIIGNNKNKMVYLVPIFGLITVNSFFYNQCYLWLAGNITYLFPTILSLLVFITIFENKLNLLKQVLLIFLSIIIPMFTENIGCAYVMFIVIMIIYHYIKERKINILLITMFLFSSISLIIMLKSPGSAIRMSLNPSFSELSFINKIIYNIENFITYTFARNVFPLMMMNFSINIMLKNKIKNKIFLIFWNIIPIITIINNIFYMIPIYFEPNFIINTAKWYYAFYWCAFEIAFFCSIFYHIKNKKEVDKLFILTIVGIISMLVMLLTPTWGERVSILYIWVIIIVTSKIYATIYESYPKKGKTWVVLIILYTLLILSYATINKVFDIRRENEINNYLNNNESNISLYANKLTTLWNYNPWNEYHLKTFKEYHHIEKDTKVNLVVPSIKEWIKYMLYGK